MTNKSLEMKFKKWFEMVGTGAIVSSCRPTADFQVWGACSDLKRKKRKKKLTEVNIKFNEIPDNNFHQTLIDGNNYTPEEIAEFALTAAKSVFNLIDEELKPLAKECIDLIEQWLNDPKSVRANVLRSSLRDFNENSQRYYANTPHTDEVRACNDACSAVCYAVGATAYAADAAHFKLNYGGITNVAAAASNAANAARTAIDAAYYVGNTINVRGILTQYLHSIDKHNNSFKSTNRKDVLDGFIEDLLNEPSHDKITIFLDFLKDEYDIENLDKLGHFSIDPSDRNSIYNNNQVLKNFIRLIQSRVK